MSFGDPKTLTKDARPMAARLLCVLFALLAFAAGAPARAQAVYTYTSGTDGTITNSTSCSSTLDRTFTVSDSFTVVDVDIGVFFETNRRGDVRMVLESPAGTRVQIVNGNNSSVTGDDFHVRLNDGGTAVVNSDTTTNHSTSNPPPYQNNFIPNNPLSAFNGESSNGTWTLEMCDMINGSGSTFRHANLYLSRDSADLSLAKVASSTTPTSGSNITFTLTLTNSSSSSLTATNVEVTDILPAGFDFVSYSGYGTYNDSTGIWSVASIDPGQSRALVITVTVTASQGASMTNGAEVTTATDYDPDSTPDNGSTTEDDDAFVTVTVSGTRVAGTPPTLSCPAGTILFDWDAISWTNGSTNNNYNVTGLGTVNFTITNPGTWLAMGGVTTPRRHTQLTGALSPAQMGLHEAVNLANRSQVVTTTITLPEVVTGLQFRIFDVDFGSSQFADRIRATGTYNGSPVTPTLTNGLANYVIGNEAYGDVSSGDTSANGNIWITFASEVDTVVIEYGNWSAAPSDPGQQFISIHDITFCTPYAEVSVAKTSSTVSDPLNGTTNPFNIPGATVRYCILISNDGPATASSVTGIDIVPSNVTYVPGSMLSGTDCGSAATAEDDDAVGADETDPVGASVSGATLTIVASSLDDGDAVALTYEATVN